MLVKLLPYSSLAEDAISGGLWDLSVLMDAVPTEGPNLALCILGRRCQVQCCFPYPVGKIPHTKWERIIPPPFQEAWKAFLDDLSKPKPSADKLDKHVQAGSTFLLYYL